MGIPFWLIPMTALFVGNTVAAAGTMLRILLPATAPTAMVALWAGAFGMLGALLGMIVETKTKISSSLSAMGWMTIPLVSFFLTFGGYHVAWPWNDWPFWIHMMLFGFAYGQANHIARAAAGSVQSYKEWAEMSHPEARMPTMTAGSAVRSAFLRVTLTVTAVSLILYLSFRDISSEWQHFILAPIALCLCTSMIMMVGIEQMELRMRWGLQGVHPRDENAWQLKWWGLSLVLIGSIMAISWLAPVPHGFDPHEWEWRAPPPEIKETKSEANTPSLPEPNAMLNFQLDQPWVKVIGWVLAGLFAVTAALFILAICYAATKSALRSLKELPDELRSARGFLSHFWCSTVRTIADIWSAVRNWRLNRLQLIVRNAPRWSVRLRTFRRRTLFVDRQPQNEVRRIYKRFLLRLERFGHKRSLGQTAQEFVLQLQADWPDDDEAGEQMYALTRTYEEARYGSEGEADRLVSRAKQLWSNVRRRLHKNSSRRATSKDRQDIDS